MSQTISTEIKPLFKYAGSKQKMLSLYAPYFFPQEPITRFVDLFAGGLTMTLWVAENYPTAEFLINDFNEELVLLYNTLQKNEDEVIKVWRSCADKWLTLDTLEERKAYYYTLRDEYTLDFTNKSDIRLAGILLFMLQTNFNGMWVSYIKCNKRYSTAPGSCNQKAAFFNEDKIKAVGNVLRNSIITNKDFSEVDIRESDFLYADPPYRDSRVDYKGGFDDKEQVRLAEFLLQHKGNFAYSNKDIHDGWYQKHFPGTNIIDLSTKYGAGYGAHSVAVSEVLITNYNPS